jgi:uncharacterized membrane protein
LRPTSHANERSAAGPSTEAKAFSAETVRAQIKQIIWDRKSSETTAVGYWRYVPSVAVSLSALTGLAFFILVPSVIGFVFGYLAIYSVSFAILAIINYKLVKSTNAHFRREAALRTLLIDLVRQRYVQSPSSGARETISKMEQIDHDASTRRFMNEMIAPMSALPIVGIVFGFAVLRQITVAQAEHDRNWNELLSQLQLVESSSGKEHPISSDRRTRKANFAAYFALSLLCFPFLAYWYHDIERKGEQHLQEQWQSEDQLAKVML